MAKSKVFFAKMDFWKPQYLKLFLTNVVQTGHKRNDEFNFVPYKGRFLRAFVSPSGPPDTRRINLAKIDKDAQGAEFIDNVLVIFFAKSPNRPKHSTELTIIGWINGARVHRKAQIDDFPLQSINRDTRGYNVEGKIANAALIPVHDRNFGLQWPGRQWVMYPDTKQTKQAVDFVTRYSGLNLLDSADRVPELEEEKVASTGFQADAKSRVAIERYSVAAATRYYESVKGYTVIKKGKPYDLHCSDPLTGEVVIVEVKGTTLSGEWVIPTRNEVNQQHLGEYDNAKSELFVMYDIVVSKDGAASPGNNEPTATAGKCAIISNWRPTEHHREAILYECKLDTSKFTHIGNCEP